MISQYILQREQLINLFVLIDIRHPQQKIDREFIDWLGASQVPFTIIFTKADKLGPVAAQKNASAWMKALQDAWEETSSLLYNKCRKEDRKRRRIELYRSN